MQVSLQQSSIRPPFIIFETRAQEDRNQTIAKGRRIDRDVDWVIIRQTGSKDTAEKEAEVWLEGLAKDPNMMPEWVDRFRLMYKQWKEGQEPTVDGTHVTQWPAINKAQASLLIAANLPTVEDLAAANEASLARIGIGARELQMKARDFLKVSNDSGKAVEEMSAMRAKLEGQEAINKRQAADLARLAAMVETLTANSGQNSVAKALAAAPSQAIAEGENNFL